MYGFRCESFYLYHYDQDLPLLFSIGTASYQFLKELAKVLAPLNQSEYLVENTSKIIGKFKNISAPENSKSFYLLTFHHCSLMRLFTRL